MEELDGLPNLRSRTVSDRHIFANEEGRFFKGQHDLLSRIGSNELSDQELKFLQKRHLIKSSKLVKHASLFAQARRKTNVEGLEYLILVPTLRCNLACSYCQVSRANENAEGYDWDEATLGQITGFIKQFSGRSLKIEFQGGEPTLRPDLISAVLDAGSHIPDMTAVICTNLQRLDEEILTIFNRENVQISTSLDGSLITHKAQRTQDDASTSQFERNLSLVLKRYGPGKISALPTVNPNDPPEIDSLVEAFVSRGFMSIYLRPINYQGFARKQHPESIEQSGHWGAYYSKFIHRLIARNWDNRDQVIEETYFSHCLNRIFKPGLDRHVDLRSPNPVGVDYIVVDFDGKIYPTDEARMLSRSGIIDLTIGDIATGWDSPERRALNEASTNADDPDCQNCVYQPYCGRDIIDDISRYGRIDLRRHETNFCKRHMSIFDLAFSLIYSNEDAVQYSLRHWLGLSGDSITLGESI
tara:strand:- start:5032 stop:6444 length:1413 start_codon:yes stop_codon:yes gene_type:complete